MMFLDFVQIFYDKIFDFFVILAANNFKPEKSEPI